MPPAHLSLPELMGTLYKLNSTPCLPQTDTLCFPHQTGHLVLMTTFLRNISEHLLLLQCRYVPYLNLFYHNGLLLGLSISCFDLLFCNFALTKCSLSKTHYSLSWYPPIDPPLSIHSGSQTWMYPIIMLGNFFFQQIPLELKFPKWGLGNLYF